MSQMLKNLLDCYQKHSLNIIAKSTTISVKTHKKACFQNPLMIYEVIGWNVNIFIYLKTWSYIEHSSGL